MIADGNAFKPSSAELETIESIKVGFNPTSNFSSSTVCKGIWFKSELYTNFRTKRNHFCGVLPGLSDFLASLLNLLIANCLTYKSPPFLQLQTSAGHHNAYELLLCYEKGF